MSTTNDVARAPGSRDAVGAAGGASFDRRVSRLLELSVGRGYDAYTDVAWDDPSLTLDPTDPRLRLFSFDPLARTRWYRCLDGEEQARVGLARMAVNFRVGWEFESLLQQGLLARAYRMGNTDPSFRYLHHEVMEESQHTLMFYEFIARHAPGARGMPATLRGLADPLVQTTARTAPALFFFMVLGGEIPIDHLQRRFLREEQVHPLVERICGIHVEEEARHVSYANAELRRRVPAMSPRQRYLLALALPPVLGVMARLMVYPTPWLLRRLGVPDEDWRAARRHPGSRALLAASVARIRALADELDLLPPAAVGAWRRLAIWS